jgi:RNA polymerase sigma-54 factor
MSDAAELIAPTTPMDSQFSKQEDVFTADPDVFVERIRGEWIIALNIDGVPRLRLNPFYLRMVDQEGASDKKPRQYLYGNVRSAAFLIEDIEQRAQMLAGVVGSIIKFQSEFLEHGVSHLKPLMLRDVADVIRSDESTVRRIVANKHVHTPQGLFALRFFFNANIVADPSNAGKRY